MYPMIKKYFTLIFLLSLIVSCTTSGVNNSSITKKQSSNNNKKTASTIHPQYAVYHVTDSLTELHFKISSKEILYTRPDGINFFSNVMISYRLMPTYDSKDIIDSSSTRLIDSNNSLEEKFLVGKIMVKAKANKLYYVRVTVADLNRSLTVSEVLTIDKTGELTRKNFLVISNATNMPIFENKKKKGQKLLIQYKRAQSTNLYVRYYNREFPLASPPFSLIDPKPFQYQPDSTFIIHTNNSGLAELTIPKNGFYHIQLDTTKKDGLTLYNFLGDYPYIKKVDEMVYPLRFITSNPEYDEMISSTNKKASVDKFWLTATGNPDRGREVVRKFYNRVQEANINYASYLEGWKTDRGMIYIIYGSPNVTYKNASSETWVYGEENNINSLSFIFNKVNNPFSDNDYMLERSVVYKQTWYTAVEIWRQGRIYLQE